MRTYLLILAIALGACGSKKSASSSSSKSSDEPVKKTYTIFQTAQKDQPPGGLKVSMTIPSSWKEEEIDASGSPTLKPGGAQGFMDQISLVLFPACSEETDPKACVDMVQGHQYGEEDLAVAKVDELGEGRRFVTHDVARDKDGKRRVHARLFAYHPGSKTVLMCVIFLGGEAADKLPEARKACESVAF